MVVGPDRVVVGVADGGVLQVEGAVAAGGGGPPLPPGVEGQQSVQLAVVSKQRGRYSIKVWVIIRILFLYRFSMLHMLSCAEQCK